MMKIKITREDGSLHSFDFYKKERCVFSISENGDMYYSIYRKKMPINREIFSARLLLQRKKILLALCGLSANLKKLGQADTTKKL